MAHSAPTHPPSNTPKLVGAWLLVGIPFAWAVWVTAGNALALFR